MKKVLSIHRGGEAHWVGDGFPVRTVFHYQDLGSELTPFLLLDHAGPARVRADRLRSAAWAGIRTGASRPSPSSTRAKSITRTAPATGGSIGPGDVQWMTAGSGVLHKELHGRDYARRGGPFEMLQLWVNLPAKSKMTAPGYQGLLARDIPVVSLPEGGGSVRVIAGEFAGAKGPARTVTPINLLDVRLRAGHRVQLEPARRLHGGDCSC